MYVLLVIRYHKNQQIYSSSTQDIDQVIIAYLQVYSYSSTNVRLSRTIGFSWFLLVSILYLYSASVPNKHLIFQVSGLLYLQFDIFPCVISW